jgi:hypothetical protein
MTLSVQNLVPLGNSASQLFSSIFCFSSSAWAASKIFIVLAFGINAMESMFIIADGSGVDEYWVNLKVILYRLSSSKHIVGVIVVSF